MTQLEERLREISTMPRSDLQRQWAKLTARPVPRLSVSMLRLALGYEIQARARGSLSRQDSEHLDTSGKTRSRAMPLTPGMRLVREWHGTVHVVTIADEGTVMWNERSWRSLSEVARVITGTRWSGPAFFGLKQRKAAA